MTPRLLAECPAALRGSLARYLAGEASLEITLMHFALHVGETSFLEALLSTLASAAPDRKELTELVELAGVNIDRLAQVGALGKAGLINIPSGEDGGVAAIRDQFDKAVDLAPEASVALYSLGSADILDRATDEIVNRLAEWGLVRSDAAVLDVGCGIGRIERTLAPRVGTITAIDVSSGMIREARRRCRELANVAFEQCNGRDLAGFRDRSFDLLLAVDSFPYLFAADPAIVARHLHDGARILRPGGAVVILNFSYRGDEAADRRDVEQLARANGFTIRRAGTRDFALWDGLSFVLSLPARRE